MWVKRARSNPTICLTWSFSYSWLLVFTLLQEFPISSGRKGPLPEHLSVEEELLVRRFYENKIQQVCAAFRLPYKIQVWIIIRTSLKGYEITAKYEENLCISPWIIFLNSYSWKIIRNYLCFHLFTMCTCKFCNRRGITSFFQLWITSSFSVFLKVFVFSLVFNVQTLHAGNSYNVF